MSSKTESTAPKKYVILKSRRQLFFFSFYVNPPPPHCSPSPFPITLFQGIPLRQSARRRVPWKQCTNRHTRSTACTSSPLVVLWDWLVLRAPGFPDSSQILEPLCNCQQQRALMIAHHHWSSASDTQAQKDLTNQNAYGDRMGKKITIFVFFLEVCWGLSPTVITLFIFNW